MQAPLFSKLATEGLSLIAMSKTTTTMQLCKCSGVTIAANDLEALTLQTEPMLVRETDAVFRNDLLLY